MSGRITSGRSHRCWYEWSNCEWSNCEWSLRVVVASGRYEWSARTTGRIDDCTVVSGRGDRADDGGKREKSGWTTDGCEDDCTAVRSLKRLGAFDISSGTDLRIIYSQSPKYFKLLWISGYCLVRSVQAIRVLIPLVL